MQNIRDLRNAQKISLKELGAIIGVSESTMSLYETGKREPDNTTLIRIADYFDVTVDYLLGRTEQKKPAPDKGDELVELLRSDPRRMALATLVFSLDEAGLDKLEKLVDIVQS